MLAKSGDSGPPWGTPLRDFSRRPLIITPARNQILFHLSDVDVVSQLMEGKFPDYILKRFSNMLEYFGQSLGRDNCGACDVCLGEFAAEAEADSEGLAIAQKILSCVYRLEERFGGDYTAKVLSGAKEQRILEQGHDQLSTWGILAEDSRRTIRDWIEHGIDG